MKRKITPSDGEGETTEENNNSRPDASGSEQVQKYKDNDKDREKYKDRERMRVDPNRCKKTKWIQTGEKVLLPSLTFSQEQSQEEDAKDCTGQISKPVS